MRNEHPQPESEFDDELDGLLARARWPEPTTESTHRLHQHWILLCRQSFWVKQRSLLAVAASVGIVMVGAWMFRNPASVQSRRLSVPVLIASSVKPEKSDAGRPLTGVELAMLRVMSARPHAGGSPALVAPAGVPLVPLVTGWSIPVPAHHAVPVPPVPSDPASLAQRAVASSNPRQRDLLLDDLIAMGPGRAAQRVFDLFVQGGSAQPAIAAVCRHSQGWSDALFSALNDPRIAVRSSAAQALAQIDGPVITGRLMAMANANINRREAIAALVRIHSADARQYVVAAKQSSEMGAIVRSALAQNVTVTPQIGDIQ